MSLKLIGEGPLCCIIKHSVAVVVALSCSLVIGVTVLVQKVVGSSVEVEQNLLDISNSPTSCMLLTRQ